MQYGVLTDAQIEDFQEAQAYSIRKPSFAVWIEGFGDPTDYVMEIDTEVALESPKGAGYLNIGRAILVVNNEGGYFYTDGQNEIERTAKIKIWAGFDDLNIPVFSGVVHSVEPVGTTDMVILNCLDYMSLLREALIKGSQDPNNTPKLIMESFCDTLYLPPANIASTDKTNAEYTQPRFDEVSMKRALEEVCNSIFYVAYFDEDGVLQAVEREHSSLADFTFDDDNVTDFKLLADSQIINDMTIEYLENFFVTYEDQASIDSYRQRSRSDRTLILNSSLVSDKTQGATAEELNYDLEAFKFTSAADAASIDCIHIKMKQDDAHGYMTVKVYSDSGGSPDSELGESQLKASNNLSSSFAWEIYYFDTPVNISPSTDYWVVIDTSSVNSGTVYVQISGADATSKHAYYDSGWNLEDDKQALHRIRGSIEAQRVAVDVVRFYKSPHERIRVYAPAAPHLQLLDEVMVDISLRQIRGHYVIEGRRHIITPENYTTIDTLRKVG